DITNYLLHAMGQPLHCFDLAKIAGGKIVVKNATQGEKFVTLDGVEHTLDSRDLMICNTQAPMCIAGVFGGLDSGVTEETTSVFLESAYFNPTSVRKTARRHGLNTDSSFRFERGVDPNNTLYVLKLAAIMVKELAGGEICGPLCDNYPEKILPAEVTLEFDYLNRLVGKDIPSDTVVAILKSLEMEIVNIDENKVDMKVPTYRVDVTRPCDVVEDVLRIYGYNNVEISDTVHSSLSYKTFEDEDNTLRNLISEQLCGEGFNEILNNSLTAEAYYADLSELPATHCVRLLNPLSNDLNVMRQSLIFGGLESLSHNINRKLGDVAMYEFGNVYFFNPDAETTAENALAPYREQSHLALWMTGAFRPGNWARPEQPATIYDLKAVVANILARLGINPAEIKLTTGSNELYAACLNVATRSGKQLGTMGIVSKKLLGKFDIKQEVLYAEFDWHALVSLARKKSVSYRALAKTMPVKRDLALLLDKSISMAEVEATVRESERRLLKDVTLFDVYEGKNLPEGKKSYAIAMTLQDDEKTLQDKQIEAVMTKVINNLKKKLNAELR
ncbi:MAG: phenylalanine--tRNA ligase subunit beta, partial [Duncaniella sp.]|nr:phenylalanine--tRNA ligase subunit beta [Duncaniella sp.]